MLPARRLVADIQTIMQLRYHSPLNPSVVEPSYHPIFYRVKERSNPSSPISPMSEFPPEIQWETRFVKCSYAMVCRISSKRKVLADSIVCGSLFVFGAFILSSH